MRVLGGGLEPGLNVTKSGVVELNATVAVIEVMAIVLMNHSVVEKKIPPKKNTFTTIITQFPQTQISDALSVSAGWAAHAA